MVRSIVLGLTLGGVLLTATSARAQPAAPKPGPEHAALKQFEGTWDATVNFMGMDMKGTGTYKLGMGGFWLTSTFKGDFGGMPFEGHGTTGYDPIKKKYVSTWIDSMSPVLMLSEGEFSKDGKKFTENGDGPNMEGKMEKIKSVTEFKDKDTIVMTMYSVKDGKDVESMKITYKRKK